MSAEKITITKNLRNDITILKKEKGFTSYTLSEASGHSKFWLSNIENGKTQKITLDDLISIYKNLLSDEDSAEDIDSEEIIQHIEQVLSQQVGDQPKKWYELVNIKDSLSEETDQMTLLKILSDLLTKDIYNLLMQEVYNMSVHEMQAAITAVQNLYYSLYVNPDLALALINVPVFGVFPLDTNEQKNALNDILAMGVKFNDLVVKNNSYDMIRRWQQMDEHIEAQNKQAIHRAYSTLNSLLKLLAEMTPSEKSSTVKNLLDTFYQTVVFPIEQARPGTMGDELPYQHDIKNGKDYADLIESCESWFSDYEDEYNLSEELEADENDPNYKKAREFLLNYGDIKADLS